MKIAFYDTHNYERVAFDEANRQNPHEMTYLDVRLKEDTVLLSAGHDCVCVFVNDKLNASVLIKLKQLGIRIIALRCAGFNQVDIATAKELGMRVIRVPEYSPYAVAEHVVALIQTLNRKTHRAYNRVREGNFSLEGLVGRDLHGKTIGIIGTGKIGSVLARIMKGFGLEILLYDLSPVKDLSDEVGGRYVSIQELYTKSDIISLHIPLSQKTKHFIDSEAFKMMKIGVTLINTGRGGLIDTRALIQALKTGKVGSAGLDVYEEEESFFFQDLSGKILSDDVLARLMTFPNVLITGHQAFLTEEALHNIAATTLRNISDFENYGSTNSSGDSIVVS